MKKYKSRTKVSIAEIRMLNVRNQKYAWKKFVGQKHVDPQPIRPFILSTRDPPSSNAPRTPGLVDVVTGGSSRSVWGGGQLV